MPFPEDSEPAHSVHKPTAKTLAALEELTGSQGKKRRSWLGKLSNRGSVKEAQPVDPDAPPSDPQARLQVVQVRCHYPLILPILTLSLISGAEQNLISNFGNDLEGSRLYFHPSPTSSKILAFLLQTTNQPLPASFGDPRPSSSFKMQGI